MNPSLHQPRFKKIGVAIVIACGHVIVGQRQPGQSFAGLAEFPGGKVEPGEDFAAAACRECLEETGLAVTAEGLLDAWQSMRVGDDGIEEIFRIEFWLCQPVSPSADLRESSLLTSSLAGAFHWVPIAELAQLKFPSANTKIIELLIKNVIDNEEPHLESSSIDD
jgi:8-oxo-dGTP diphosphatase